MGIDSNIDKIYQKIREFAASFQWIEHLLRQIGWLILEPERINWPPLRLRDETSKELLKEVEKLYDAFMDNLSI